MTSVREQNIRSNKVELTCRRIPGNCCDEVVLQEIGVLQRWTHVEQCRNLPKTLVYMEERISDILTRDLAINVP